MVKLTHFTIFSHPGIYLKISCGLGIFHREVETQTELPECGHQEEAARF